VAPSVPWRRSLDLRGLSQGGTQRRRVPRLLPQPASRRGAGGLAESHRGRRALGMGADRRVASQRGPASGQGGAAPDPARVGRRPPSGMGLVSHRGPPSQQSLCGESAACPRQAAAPGRRLRSHRPCSPVRREPRGGGRDAACFPARHAARNRYRRTG
jgi:hypothetical protein